MHTEAINHDPAITFIQTGSQQPGRPSFGAWVDYGLGTMNQDLPAFVVMISKSGTKGQGLLARAVARYGPGAAPSATDPPLPAPGDLAGDVAAMFAAAAIVSLFALGLVGGALLVLRRRRDA